MAKVFINKSNEITDSKKAYQLCDKDVFSINDICIEFEKGRFYEVEEVIYDGLYNVFNVWERTGKEFSVEEINDLTK